MADAIVSYKFRNKFDKYYALPTTEQAKYDDLAANFAKELVTEKGSCIFDREYGTLFYHDIGDIANIHKMRSVVSNNAEAIKYKYGIEQVDVGEAKFNSKDGFLEISLRILFRDVALNMTSQILYSGTYTDKDIVEIG